MVTTENWEEYAILRADGELDVEGTAALEVFLAAHPELAEEARMFDSLRLAPDETVVFTGKESLLKPEPRVIRFDRRWVYGVAAGVALLIGSLAVMRSGEEGTNEAARMAGGVKLPTREIEVLQTLPADVDVEKAEQQVAESTAVAQTAHPRSNKARTGETGPRNITPPVQPATEDAPGTTESIAPMLSADARMLVVTPPPLPRAGVVVSPDAEPSFRSQTPGGSPGILGRLPIEAERLALVDDLRKTASDRIQSIREAREKIRNTDVTIALGRRDLFTLHF